MLLYVTVIFKIFPNFRIRNIISLTSHQFFFPPCLTKGVFSSVGSNLIVPVKVIQI